MPLIIDEGMYLAKLRWRLETDPEEIVSTIGLRNNEPGPRDLNDVALAVFNAWMGAFEVDTMMAAYSFVGVDIDEGTATAETNQGTYNETIVGTSSGDPLPQNCALLIKKKSAQSGRRNSGRMFIPPAYIGEGAVSPTGMISSGEVPVLQGWATQFYDNLRDSTDPTTGPPTSFQPVIFHSTATGSAVTFPATDITSLVFDPLLATQRRRMRH